MEFCLAAAIENELNVNETEISGQYLPTDHTKLIRIINE